MKAKIACCSVLLFVAVIVMSYKIPEGWIRAGSRPDDYEMGIDPGSGRNGNNAATIASSHRKAEGFGTLMQNVDPEKYKGKRVRLSGYIKADNVDNWAALWLRVDGESAGKSVTTVIKKGSSSGKIISNVSNKESKKMLAFDNMSNRPIRGTAGWTKCEIVLDVADTATNIAFGALLHGSGQIWFDDLKFEAVGQDVPVTSNRNKEPVNLNFDK